MKYGVSAMENKEVERLFSQGYVLTNFGMFKAITKNDERSIVHYILQLEKENAELKQQLQQMITMNNGLRPCEVKGSNGFFHCWEQINEVLEPSLLKGGHCGGQLSCVYGIIEFEDGKVCRVKPYDIRFTNKGDDIH